MSDIAPAFLLRPAAFDLQSGPDHMIISLPKDLPATCFLRDEGLVVVDEDCPVLPILKPVRVALVNLMPNKSETELQFARLLGRAPYPVELTLVRPGGHVCRNTPELHLERHYRTIPEYPRSGFRRSDRHRRPCRTA